MSDNFAEPLSEKSSNVQPFSDHNPSKGNSNGGNSAMKPKSGFESENCPPLKIDQSGKQKLAEALTPRKSNKENEGRQDAPAAGN